jgi:polysaccharide biosynthesis/export protein
MDQILGPQNQPPGAPFETPFGAPNQMPAAPFETPFGAPNQMPGAPAERTPSGQPPSGNIRQTGPPSSAAVEPTSESRSATIPDQQVAPDGTIGVPYAGRVPAAGRTAEEVQKTIEASLANKALGPQALVIVRKSDANTVTVAGEVVAGARVPLSAGGDRLLQVIAARGGITAPAGVAAAGAITAPLYETFVRLSRGGVTVTIPLEQLVADPAEDIYAQPGDVLTLVRIPQTFSIFGAAGRNATITFNAEKLTLSEALAKSQGLRDDLANPKGVFVFRYEPASIVRALGQPMATRAEDGTSPVAYRFDLSDVNSYLLAKKFPVRDKDIVFVADAAAVQVQKLFTLLSSVTGPVITGLLACSSSNVKC